MNLYGFITENYSIIIFDSYCKSFIYISILKLKIIILLVAITTTHQPKMNRKKLNTF